MRQLKVEQFDEMCINKDGNIKIFSSNQLIEINKEVAYELGIFLYKVLDLVAPEEITEETTEEVTENIEEGEADPKK